MFYNTGTYGTPVWSKIDKQKDLGLNLEKEEADVTNRDSAGWEETVGTIKKANIEFDILYVRTNTSHTALQNSFLNGTAMDCLILDGDSAEVGAKGYRMQLEVMSWPREENLKEAMKTAVKMKPTYSSNPPAAYTVT
jgi:predicted secreted protein